MRAKVVKAGGSHPLGAIVEGREALDLFKSGHAIPLRSGDGPDIERATVALRRPK